MPVKRIVYIGNLDGSYIRFAPNFGFRLGNFVWSRRYGTKR